MEIALRAYVNESLNDWADYLAGFSLSYNTTVHSSTGYTPSFLLRGYHPRTLSTVIPLEVQELAVDRASVTKENPPSFLFLDPESAGFTEQFDYHRNLAKDALKLAQSFQEKYYNENHITKEFDEGDLVLLNLHSLQLLRNFKGRGRKMLPRFDGPFEILEKISAVAYRLRLPASYQGHPVINIAHLEAYYQPTVDSHITRPRLTSRQKTFEDLEEFEVERVLDSKMVRGPNGCRIRKYQVRWKGYSPKYDTWETRQSLRNAPEALREFERGSTRPSAL